MITQVLRTKELGNPINLSSYVELQDGIRCYRDVFSTFSTAGIDTDKILAPCLFRSAPNVDSKVVIDYYTNTRELFIALCASHVMDGTQWGIYNYFLELSEEYTDITEQELEKIKMFSYRLDNTGYRELDVVLESNQEDVNMMIGLLESIKPIKPREVIKDFSQLNVNSGMLRFFAKEIVVNYLTIERDSSALNCPTICSGLFKIKRNRCNEEVITNDMVVVIEKILSKNSSPYLTDYAQLAFSDKETISFSILYLECLNKMVERIV